MKLHPQVDSSLAREDSVRSSSKLQAAKFGASLNSTRIHATSGRKVASTEYSRSGVGGGSGLQSWTTASGGGSSVAGPAANCTWYASGSTVQLRSRAWKFSAAAL